LYKAGTGHIFGETFSMGNTTKLPVSIMAVEKSELLIFSSRRILRPCASMCSFHTVLIRNVIRDLARKNMVLMKKIEHISRRTTREKLLSYLSSQSQNKKSDVFDIPFNRQELADYLSVDRSAMSTELSRMRDDGLIKFCKNRFELC
jgi:CRP-like cAMP-binding protein